MEATQVISECLAIVAKVPFDDRGRRSWQHAADLAGKIAAIVIRHGVAAGLDLQKVAQSIGMPIGALRHFIRGRTSSGSKWPELLGVLQREGVEPVKDRYNSSAVTAPVVAIPPPSAPVKKPRPPAPAPAPSPAVESLPGARPVMKWIDDTGAEHTSSVDAAKASMRHRVIGSARTLSETHTEHKDFVRAILEHGDLVIALAETIKAERAFLATL